MRENYVTGDHGYYVRNKMGINLGQILAPILPEKNDEDNLYNKFNNSLYNFNIEPFYDYGYAKNKISGSSGRMSGTGVKTIYSGKYFDASLTYSWGLSASNLVTSDEKENKMIYFEVSLKCC